MQTVILEKQMQQVQQVHFSYLVSYVQVSIDSNAFLDNQFKICSLICAIHHSQR